MSELLFNILFFMNAIVFAFFFFILAVIIASFFSKNKLNVSYLPKVSIIVPCYNEEKRISEFFESLLLSSYDKRKIEVILVDDGSTDKTVSNALIFSKRILIKIVKTKHLGKVGAFNAGVKVAKNELIVCLDADTFVTNYTIKNLVQGFSNSSVGAISGICLVKNNSSILGVFQDLEYFYVALVRKSFFRVFHSGMWFFGAVSAFRKSVFLSVGGFSTSTLTEDHDFSLAVMQKGYSVVTAYDAIAYTLVPNTISNLVSQRTRWWFGALQTIKKNIFLLFKKDGFVFGFVVLNQIWWYIFAVISLPLLVYQFLFWFPNDGVILSSLDYIFRWFSAYGAVYLLFMLKQWNLSLYQALGSICGLLTILIMTFSILQFGSKLTIKRVLALFFYFPYTILLNMIIILSLLKVVSKEKKFFYK